MKIRVTTFSMVLAAAIGSTGLMSGVTLAQQGSPESKPVDGSKIKLAKVQFDRVEVKQALSDLFKMAGISQYSVDNNLEGVVTLYLTDVTFDQALRAVAAQAGAAMNFNGPKVHIFKNPADSDGTVCFSLQIHSMTLEAFLRRITVYGDMNYRMENGNLHLYPLKGSQPAGFGAVGLGGYGDGFGGGLTPGQVGFPPAQGGFGGEGVSLPGRDGFGGGVAAAPAQGGFGGSAIATAPSGQQGGFGGSGFGGNGAMVPARAAADAGGLTPMPTTGATSITQDDKYLYILRGNELTKVQKSDLKVMKRTKI